MSQESEDLFDIPIQESCTHTDSLTSDAQKIYKVLL